MKYLELIEILIYVFRAEGHSTPFAMQMAHSIIPELQEHGLVKLDNAPDGDPQ